MLDGTYNVALNTPMGPINGNITLITNGNNVQGIIETMGMRSSFNGNKISNDKCRFDGAVNSPFGKINYNATCSVFENNLELDANTGQGTIKIVGKRIK